jgi:hypothetical protein
MIDLEGVSSPDFVEYGEQLFKVSLACSDLQAHLLVAETPASRFFRIVVQIVGSVIELVHSVFN